MAMTKVIHFDDGGSTDPYSSDYVDPYAGISDVLTGGQSGITSDGSGGFIDANGTPVNSDGTPIASYSNEGKNYPTPNSTAGAGGSPVNASMDPSILAAFNKMAGTSLTADTLAKLGIGAGALAGLTGLNNPTVNKVGYQGGIPELQANRSMITAPPPGHVPGSGGINYGGDVTYSPKGTAVPSTGGSYTPSASDVAKTAGVAAGGLGGLSDLLRGMPAGAPNWYDQNTYEGYAAANNADLARAANAQKSPMSFTDDVLHTPTMSKADWTASRSGPVSNMAQGGITALAHGGSSGQYLQGTTDGMADKLSTTIDGKQPAALSHGEFVVPADVVSHLGNGNSDAGAKKLYSMMDKIREARTGTKKQGKQINPDKFMPGGPVGYAAGGSVRHFATGDAVGSAAAAGVTGTEQAPSSWAGDYITNMLGQGQALANAPYQQYQGPLTAGASDLQNQAFQTAGNLQTPASVGQAAQTAGNVAGAAQNMTYNPTQATNQFNAPTPYNGIQATSGTFGNEQAQQYMNPYLQQSLNPQLEEARRQSDITAQQNNAAMTKAGAFGGGRQAILTAENQRNLGTNLANITGQGYNTAYTNAMGQYNADQARNMQAQQANIGQQQFGAQQGMTGAQNAAQYGQAAQQANIGQQQFGANLGLQGLQLANQAAQTQGNLGIAQNQAGLANLSEQANLGATQRGISSEGIAADKAAFEAARQAPYQNIQFEQSLLNGLPITATNYALSQPSALTSAAAGATTVNTLLNTLGLGTTPPK